MFKSFLTRFLLVALIFSSLPLPAVRAIDNSRVPVTSILQIIAQQKKSDGSYQDMQMGSAVITDSQGTVMTNAHVVLDSKYKPFDRYLGCMAKDINTAPVCKYILDLQAADADFDLAVLQMSTTDVDGHGIVIAVSPISWGRPNTMQSGFSLYILGYPAVGGQTITLTKGSVSGFLYDNRVKPPEMTWIKTDASINPGNSGGAALDDAGYFMGMPTFVVSQGSSSSIGYVRPAFLVEEWLNYARKELKTKTAPLIVKELPDDVTNFKAKPLNTGAELSWSPSTTSDGIKNYEITYDTQKIDFSNYGQDSDLPHYQTTSDTKLTIGGLQNGTTYYFYILAVSNQGYASQFWTGPVQVTPTATPPSTTLFSDISQTHKNYLAISYLKDKQMISGYQDGTFRPDQLVNRAELAKMLVTTQKQTPDPTQYKNCFKDVHEEWFAMYVCYAKEKGWVAGYANGTFKPAQNVNRAESIKMIVNAFGLSSDSTSPSAFSDVTAQAWYAAFVRPAEQNQLLEEQGTFRPERLVTRSEVSENMYRAALIKELGDTSNSPVWTSPTQGAVQVNDYFPLMVGKEWTYEVTAAGQSAGEEKITVKEKCNTGSNCFLVEHSVLGAGGSVVTEYRSMLDTVMAWQEVENFNSNQTVKSYVYPSLAFSNRNRYAYFKYTAPYLVEDSADGQVKVLDGVTGVKLLGFESIDTPDGKKEALKISMIDLLRAEVQTAALGDITVPATLRYEQTIYLVKGIGVVQRSQKETLLVATTNSPIGVDTVEQLKSYK